ncbi:MAG TPA: hypothetical protein VFT66_06495, partial [Roseiflexaceae bacterium]|nr:hypothetical protein [Roseiflexaceae bacterium]
LLLIVLHEALKGCVKRGQCEQIECQQPDIFVRFRRRLLGASGQIVMTWGGANAARQLLHLLRTIVRNTCQKDTKKSSFCCGCML